MVCPLCEMGRVAALHLFVVEETVQFAPHMARHEDDFGVEINLLWLCVPENLTLTQPTTPHDIGNNYIVADGEHARFGENTDCATKRKTQLP